MAKFTDGRRTVEILIREWDERNSRYTPDWSGEFFMIGCLEEDEETGACIVDDVEYCIDQAMDWKNNEGDSYSEYVTDEELANRDVDITDL